MNSEDRITYFAETDYRNQRTPFGIRASDRSRHTYVIGKTGMGKSTLLENMAVQDIQNGEGMAFIDPHGAAVEKLLSYVPEERVKDVVYFAPFDLNYPVAFNIMEDVGYDRRHLVANGLMSAFKKIWVDAWSARMEYILNNCILALLEYPGSTLLSVNKMLTSKKYREKVVDNITDPSVKAFWTEEFAKYTDRYAQEATPAIQNKIGQFTSNPLIRNIVGQPHSSFDLREAMDQKKIILMNMSKGQMGEQNADLLGSMLVTKIYLAAMSRADLSDRELGMLPNFYFYVDEFQSFANESFADILSEARKYKLNLTIAHQYVEQMPEEVRAAVFGNVGSMISFRVGAYDAELLEKEFMPKFAAQDIVNLGFAQIYLRLMINGIGSQPFSAVTMPPIPKPAQDFREVIISESRRNFAQPRDLVSEQIDRLLQEDKDEPAGQKRNGKNGAKKKVPSDPPGHPAPPKRNIGGGRNQPNTPPPPQQRHPQQAQGAPNPQQPHPQQTQNPQAPFQQAPPFGFPGYPPFVGAPQGPQNPQGPQGPYAAQGAYGPHAHPSPHQHPAQNPRRDPRAFAHEGHASPHAYDHSYAHGYQAPPRENSEMSPRPQPHQTPRENHVEHGEAAEQTQTKENESAPKKTLRLSDLKKKESKRIRKKDHKSEHSEKPHPSQNKEHKHESPKTQQNESPLKAALADAISEHESDASHEKTKDAQQYSQKKTTNNHDKTSRRHDGVSKEVLERILKVEEEESRNDFS